jgi:uncharacterized membrane protein YecN with MAPEG domain
MAVFFVCAGLIGVLAVLLTVNVGRLRTAKKIFLGDGGDKEMLSAIRAHANLIEFAPLVLLLIWAMHGPFGHRMPDILAVLFVIARWLHAGGMLGIVPLGRMLGAIGTTLVLAWASVALIIAGIRAL